MNPMKLNPIAKLRRVFTMPKMFHKGKGGSARVTDCPSARTPGQSSRQLSSKIKRAISWRPRRPSRFSRCRGATKIFRDPPPEQIAVKAISADISRSGSLYVADVKNLSRARTPSWNNCKSGEKATLCRSRSLPEWKTQGSDLQVLPISGPMRYNFWPLSPR